MMGRVKTGAVHPHACGEQARNCCTTSSHPGSSPRVWGTVQKPSQRHAIQRFIPTRVGNSSGFASTNIETCGSSPRVWGTGL